MNNEKPLLKRITSLFVVLCMMFGMVVPLASIDAHAAAPTSYTTVTADSSTSVSITSSGTAKYFKFVPTQSGTYEFYSTDYSHDPYGELLDASGNTLTYNDDGGDGLNFSITYDCTAGTTYYIKARLYSSSYTGSFTLNVDTISVDPTPTPTPTENVVYIDTANGTNYPLFNSGNSTASGWDDYMEINPAPNTYTNNGYDLHGNIDLPSTARFILGMSFKVDIDISEQTKLQVKAWDVDESMKDCGSGYEYDYIYLVDETDPTATIKLAGHMSGQNNTWNNTEFVIDPSSFQKGHTYHFELQMTCTGSHTCSYYEVIVRTVNLIVNGASEPPIQTGIKDADLEASISSSGLVSVDLTASAYEEEDYTLEYKAVCTSDNAQYGGKEYSVTISTASAEYDTTFQLESDAKRGTYEITVFIKDSTETVVATRTASASYGYSAVSYNANGGSQNLPTDGTTYSSGDTVTVKFDYIPSMYGYTFLGWSTDRYASEPMYTESGAKTFTIGASDVTLYAIWELDVCEHEWEETSRTNATCTADGTVVNTCSLCGEEEEAILSKLGHNYVGGYCSRCGAAEPSADVWDGTTDTSWYSSSNTEFTIYTAEQLAGLAYLVNNGNNFSGKTVRLGNNIDLAGRNWTPIGKGILTDDVTTSTNAFYGTFDGCFYTISNLNINSSTTSFTGLFGALYGGACISNLGIENATVRATGIGEDRCTAGILAGASDDDVTINNCYTTGQLTVNGNSSYLDIGCIIGDCYDTTVTNCYANADIVVSSADGGHVGGLFGYFDGISTASRCLYIGNINATGVTYIGAIHSDASDDRDTTFCYYNSNESASTGTYVSDTNLTVQTAYPNLDFTNVWVMGTEHPVLRGFGNHAPQLPHTHSFVESSRTEPTCTADGRIYSVCSCGEEEETVLPKLGHNYVGGYCSRCGAAEPSADVWDGTTDTSWYSSSNTEFTIYTAEQLAGLAYLVNNGNNFSGKTIYLGNNIDLANRKWTPIGISETYYFAGTFNGQKHTISNLKIESGRKYAGLFGCVRSAVFTSVGVINADIDIAYSDDYIQAGILCGGYCGSDTVTISNCFVSGNISAENTGDRVTLCGGIIGYGNATITNSYSTANVYAKSNNERAYAGGIMGGLYSSVNISNSYFVGNATAYAPSNEDAYAAGILGVTNGSILTSATIRNCFVSGTFTVQNANTKYVDAIYCPYLGSDTLTVNNNYYSDVHLYKGTSSATTTYGTSTGITNLGSESWISSNMGWDFDTVWEFIDGNDYPVLQGFNDSAPQLPHTHNFVESSRTEPTCTVDGRINYTCSCGEEEETVLPKLGHNYVGGYCSRCGAAEPSADVWDGTTDTSWYSSSNTEFTIYTAEQLAGLAYLVNNGNTFSGKTVRLGNNIDLANREWTPIGISETYYFSGTFNGQKHTISNLKIESSREHVGLFGCVRSAVFTSIGVINADIDTVYSADSTRAGILCGGYYGEESVTISNCFVSGNISAENTGDRVTFCGGIIGVGNATITNSYSIANVYAKSNDNYAYAGGIMGGLYSFANISNSYFVGDATAYAPSDENAYAAGILAVTNTYSSNSTTIRNCFVSGTFTAQNANTKYVDAIYCPFLGSHTITVNNNYYSDVHLYKGTSSATTTYGTSTGITNLRSESWISSNMDWDFDTVWEFIDGNDYPVLQGFNDSVPQTPHTHDFEESSRTEPTCTVDGRINYTCSCGETKTGVIPATGHDIETTVETEVTCTSDGLIVDRCINDGCDYEKSTVIHGEHDYTITDRQDATCETPGYIEYTCSKCGNKNYEHFEGRHNYVETSRVEAQVDVEGSITYTCTECDDSYSIVIPALNPVLKNSAVLLIQNTLPWAEDVNTSLLETLKDRGVVAYYNIINTSAITSTDLTQYGVVFIANDQTTSMYNDLAANAEVLENYVRAGGNLIYGACDEGWGGSGYLTHDLPGGVTSANYYSVHNYIVNGLHPIVTGVYTDNRSLADELLKGNYCSHTYFNKNSLPEDTDVILRDANGNPTLIEYKLGNGTVIASGLTWEYFYVRNHYSMITNYSKYAYDDLVTYMVYMSNTCEHDYEMVETVEPTCIANGYTMYVCTICSHEYKGDIISPVDHTPGDWIIEEEATCLPGSQYKQCTVCDEIIQTEEIKPTDDHIASEWIVDIAPSGTQTGSRHKECTVCHTVLETDEMPALAKIIIGNAEAEAGHTVSVTIDVQNNPGIIGALLTLSYDPMLTLKSVETGDAWGSLNFTNPAVLSNPCNFVWDGVDTSDFENGTILTLTFEVSVDAVTGEAYDIGASYEYGNLINVDLEAVDMEIENGSITITNTVGDVNNDGKINLADVIVLRRYLAGGYGVTIDEFGADMDSDGNITIADVVLLRRFLVD